ncbi:MAG TPA: hypothetical protein VI913_03630 [Candidatus Peribacteraceae bacterium]|nr:hypothetical protein [Candidatus Peribacteraceae bacterium]
MKRLLPLLAGLFIFWAHPAFAALGSCTSDPAAKDALGQQPTSSHYVGKVLQRIEAGINNAQSKETVDVTDGYREEWLPRLAAAMNRIVDSDIALGEEQDALFEQTACTALDFTILEAATEEVRCELGKAYEEGRASALPLLIDLMGFARDRQKNFLSGYADPFIEDVTWHRIYSFDDISGLNTSGCLIIVDPDVGIPFCIALPGPTCQANGGQPFLTYYGCMANGHQPAPDVSLPSPELALCPFSTDYLPPMAGGYVQGSSSSASSASSSRRALSYGCDLKTAPAYGSYAPTMAEMKALEGLLAERDIFIKGVGDLGGAAAAINQSADGPDLTHFGSTVSELWEHGSFKGCFHQILNDAKLPPDVAKLVKATSSARSSQPAQAAVSNLIYLLGLTRLEPRGSFAFERNESAVIKRLIEQRVAWTARRAAAETLVPREVSALFVFDLADLLDSLVRSQAVLTLSNRSQQQAVEESIAVAKLVDAPIRLSHHMASLRQGTAEIGILANKLDKGMRNFGRGLTWFLLRSCLGRPGAVELGNVLKVILADQCFPYTNGTFLGNPAVHQACLNAVKN